MFWTLRPEVFGVAVGDDLVFLDLTGDEYTCLPRAARGIEIRPDASVVGLDDELAQTLLDGEIILQGAGSRPRAPPLPERASRDLGDVADGQVTAGAIFTAIGVLDDLRRLGRDPPVIDLLEIGGQRHAAKAADPDIIQAQARIFRTLLPWLPVEGQCLKRSALLTAFLRRRGLNASWVFGVRTWPFRAHCWVQYDGVCLNDDAERLRAYTPILCR